MEQKRDRKKKQKYLRQEIMDKGYSPKEFIEFCSHYKETNIDRWTFQELQNFVDEFHKKKDEIPDELESSSEEHPQRDPPANSLPEPSLEVPNAPRTVNLCQASDFFEVETRKAPQTQLGQAQEVGVKIGEAIIESAGLLRHPKLFYWVHTESLNWVVKRKVSDFNKLREVMSTMFPGHYVPPQPRQVKKAYIKNEHYKKLQKSYLQEFTNYLVSVPLFRNSEFFQAFLQEKDREAFKNLSLVKSKEKPPNSVEDMTTVTGKAVCDLQKDSLTESKLSTYITHTKNLKKQIKKKAKTVEDKICELANLLSSLNSSVLELAKVQKHIPYNDNYSGFFLQMQQFFKDWSEFEFRNTEIMNEYCSFFSRFGYRELKPLNELLKYRDSKFPNFTKAQQKLSKEHKPVIRRHNLDVGEDSKASQVYKFKQEAGYFNYQQKTQTKLALKYVHKTELDHFIQFLVETSANLQQFYNSSQTIINKL